MVTRRVWLQAAELGVSPTRIKCFALDPVSDGTSNVSGALIKHVTAYKVDYPAAALRTGCVLAVHALFRSIQMLSLATHAWSALLLCTVRPW